MIFKSAPGKKTGKKTKTNCARMFCIVVFCCCLFLFFSLETRVGDPKSALSLDEKRQWFK